MPTKTAATKSLNRSSAAEHPPILGHHEQRAAKGDADCAPERDHHGRRGTADPAGLDFAHRGGERRSRADDRPDVELGGHRLDHQQRADEAHADRGPAPPADRLAIEHHRQRGDDQRGDLQHRGDVGELHMRERGDEARGRQPVAERARGQQPAHRLRAAAVAWPNASATAPISSEHMMPRTKITSPTG